MNERIKSLRKTLQLSQDEFGSRLGVTGPGISKIESGHRNVTEQMEKAICREFHVDIHWLRTGEGEMFLDESEGIDAVLESVLGIEDDYAKRLFKAFAKLDKSEWAVLKKLMDSCKDDN